MLSAVFATATCLSVHPSHAGIASKWRKLVLWVMISSPLETPNIPVFSSFQEWANTMVRRPSSVRLSVCKLLRKLLLADKWPDHHQTFTRWTPGQRASRMCSRSRLKFTWYGQFCAGTKIASTRRQMAGLRPYLHRMVTRWTCIQGMLKVKIKAKGHVIWALLCWHENRFSQANDRIVTKLAHDGHQVSVHPGCAQDQGQRSRDTRTFVGFLEWATPSLTVWLEICGSSRNSKGVTLTPRARAIYETGVGMNWQFCNFSTYKPPYLRNSARWDQGYYWTLIGNRICAFDWYQNHWPRMNLNWPWTAIMQFFTVHTCLSEPTTKIWIFDL